MAGMAAELPEGASTSRNQLDTLAQLQSFFFQLLTYLDFARVLVPPGSTTKVPAAPATPEAIGTVTVKAAIIIARKSATADNAGEVRVGDSTNQYIPLLPGDKMYLGPVAGARFDLSQWYVKSNVSGDGVTVQYI